MIMKSVALIMSPVLFGVFDFFSHYASAGDRKKTFQECDDYEDYQDPTDEELIKDMFPDEDARNEFLEDGI